MSAKDAVDEGYEKWNKRGDETNLIEFGTGPCLGRTWQTTPPNKGFDK